MTTTNNELHNVPIEIATQALTDVSRALARKAKNDDAKAAQLLYQMQGLLIDRQEIVATTTPGEYSALTAYERNSRIDEIHAS
jgi:hypothetical protein